MQNMQNSKELVNKMEYSEFKEAVKKEFLNYLPDEYKEGVLEIRPVEKINENLDGLTLRLPHTNVSPTIYINYMYEEYLDTDFNHVLTRAAKVYADAMEDNEDISVSSLMEDENIKEKIVFQIINTEQNREMLANIPHREFLDLSIIYRMIVDMNEEHGVASAIITNELSSKFALDEIELFKLAVVNTKRLFPAIITPMSDIISRMFADSDMSSIAMDTMLDDIPSDAQMFVISNMRGVNGAVSILYEDELHNLAEKLGSDLYILPSSIHECILISAKCGDPYELAQMVTQINMSEVRLNERLSNQVYHYDKDLRKISLATDTPNKRLDGIVA